MALKPCPFCASSNIEFDMPVGYLTYQAMHCLTCGAIGPFCGGRNAKAIGPKEAWNVRLEKPQTAIVPIDFSGHCDKTTHIQNIKIKTRE